MRTPAALEAIAEIARSVPGAHVGAGTIVEPAQIAGGRARRREIPGEPGHVAGARHRGGAIAGRRSCPASPRPRRRWRFGALGFRALKLFPAEAVGGARLLASLHAPLPDLVFCPTGGIDAAKAMTYLALPNVLCVGGSWMLPKAALETGDYAEIEKLARAASGLKAS